MFQIYLVLAEPVKQKAIPDDQWLAAAAGKDVRIQLCEALPIHRVYQLLEPFVDLDLCVSVFFHIYPQLPAVFNVLKSNTAILCAGIILPLMWYRCPSPMAGVSELSFATKKRLYIS